MSDKTIGNFTSHETSNKGAYKIGVKKYGDNHGYFMGGPLKKRIQILPSDRVCGVSVLDCSGRCLIPKK